MSSSSSNSELPVSEGQGRSWWVVRTSGPLGDLVRCGDTLRDVLDELPLGVDVTSVRLLPTPPVLGTFTGDGAATRSFPHDEKPHFQRSRDTFYGSGDLVAAPPTLQISVGDLTRVLRAELIRQADESYGVRRAETLPDSGGNTDERDLRLEGDFDIEALARSIARIGVPVGPPPRRRNLGVTARRLAEALMGHPDLDVLVEDVAWVITLSDVTPEMEAATVPLQRVVSTRVVYVRPDYDCINHDIDFSVEPSGGRTQPVLQILGSNTE